THGWPGCVPEPNPKTFWVKLGTLLRKPCPSWGRLRAPEPLRGLANTPTATPLRFAKGGFGTKVIPPWKLMAALLTMPRLPDAASGIMRSSRYSSEESERVGCRGGWRRADLLRTAVRARRFDIRNQDAADMMRILPLWGLLDPCAEKRSVSSPACQERVRNKRAGEPCSPASSTDSRLTPSAR